MVHSHRQPAFGACLACIYKHIPDELSREKEIARKLGVEVETVQKGFADHEAAKRISGKHPELNADALVGQSFESLFKARCGQDEINSHAIGQALAPFAFIPNLAGALLAIELLRVNAGRMDTNYMTLSPWAPPHVFTRSAQPKESKCEFCSDDLAQGLLQKIWPELFGGFLENTDVA